MDFHNPSVSVLRDKTITKNEQGELKKSDWLADKNRANHINFL